MRAESVTRAFDERIESLNNLFLNEFFYEKETVDFVRVKNKKLQMAGVDSVFTYEGIQYSCDEKVAAHFINKPLKTFSFELSFIDRSGKVRDGWFIDWKKDNDSFLLCWIDGAINDRPNKVEDITSAEILLITKDGLFEYLKEISWNIKKLKLKSDRIRNFGDKSFGDIDENGIKFVYSERLVEKPVNLIIPRIKLREIAKFSNRVNNNVSNSK